MKIKRLPKNAQHNNIAYCTVELTRLHKRIVCVERRERTFFAWETHTEHIDTHIHTITLVSRSSTGFIAYDLSSDAASLFRSFASPSESKRHRIMTCHITRPETLPTNHGGVAHVQLGTLTHTQLRAIRHKRYGHTNIPFMDPSSVHSRVHRLRCQQTALPGTAATHLHARRPLRSVGGGVVVGESCGVDIHNCVMRTDKSSHREGVQRQLASVQLYNRTDTRHNNAQQRITLTTHTHLLWPHSECVATTVRPTERCDVWTAKRRC